MSGYEQLFRRLDEVGKIARGKSKHRPRNDPGLYGGPYPFIQTGDVKHADFYVTQFSQTYSEAGLSQSKLWPAGTLCITIAANIAETAILAIDACFPDSIIGFNADADKCDVRFVKYKLETIKQHYQQVAQGAAQDNLSLEKLLALKFKVPPKSVQERIADTLTTYDDLMENNRRRMALLEESARLLYREWFVHLRFPGHEKAKLINGVPKGWERVPAPEAIEVNPRIKLPDEDQHWYVEMADLPTDSMVIQSAIKREGRSGSKFQNGDTLFARITPCLENGKTGYVNFMAEREAGRGSTEFIVLRSKRLTPEFVYCMARTYEFRENAIRSMIGASGRQRAQESCFAKFQVWCPPQSILKAFSEFTEPAFEQIKNLHLQTQKLRTARDLLLPRLMSGEITV